ncbi:TolC family protein [Alteromonas sp. 009811495]|uniref:TolC family protein n=1 Tax=Alteromonas sp. 009811495 TaxID=3002962 RepID=UPI00237EE4DD|nr:TolC family protein [Alteromonas sp. 009811495]WDT85210.1 TolC family protein [Alteromonas sp. 009811495]
MMYTNSMHLSKVLRLKGVLVAVLTATFVSQSQGVLAAALSLEQAQQLAISEDPNLKGNSYRQQALKSEQHASAYWANPQLSTSIQNLPTDGFSLDQEPMTQFKVGIKQQLPRGDVNALNYQKLAVMTRQVDTQSVARLASLKKAVSLIWLDWYYANERLALLKQEEQLLKQLMDVTESRYSQGLGKSQQSDILQVRLAQLTLEDKYTKAHQALLEARAALSEFYGAPLSSDMTPDNLALGALLYGYTLDLSDLYRVVSDSEPFSLLQHHPEARGLQLQSDVQAKQVDIAREQTKPQWSVDASYGYRQDAQNGASRADFVSLGVQVDLPFFTRPKQDADVAAAVSRVNALKTDFRLKVNQLASQAQMLKVRLASLSKRKALYENGLTNEVEGLAQTLLSAYTADTANFSEVVQAHLRQIQVQDSLLAIHVEEAKTLASLIYLYAPSLEASNHNAMELNHEY